jgi:hypothetical protein
VQQHVLAQIHGPELSVYSVWVPIMAGDSQRQAERATSFLPDARVKHFWTPEIEAANLFREAIGLSGGEPVWDVYFLYESDALWQNEAPKPDFFMHQLRGLPEENLLDGEELSRKTNELIARQAQPAERSSDSTRSSTG